MRATDVLVSQCREWAQHPNVGPRAVRWLLCDVADRLEKECMDAPEPPDGWPEPDHEFEQAWCDFIGRLRKRIDAGRAEYGDVSFTRPPAELIGEMDEELLDVCGWAFVHSVALRRKVTA